MCLLDHSQFANSLAVTWNGRTLIESITTGYLWGTHNQANTVFWMYAQYGTCAFYSVYSGVVSIPITIKYHHVGYMKRATCKRTSPLLVAFRIQPTYICDVQRFFLLSPCIVWLCMRQRRGFMADLQFACGMRSARFLYSFPLVLRVCMCAFALCITERCYDMKGLVYDLEQWDCLALSCSCVRRFKLVVLILRCDARFPWKIRRVLSFWECHLNSLVEVTFGYLLVYKIC